MRSFQFLLLILLFIATIHAFIKQIMHIELYIEVLLSPSFIYIERSFARRMNFVSMVAKQVQLLLSIKRRIIAVTLRSMKVVLNIDVYACLYAACLFLRFLSLSEIVNSKNFKLSQNFEIPNQNIESFLLLVNLSVSVGFITPKAVNNVLQCFPTSYWPTQ